MNKNWDGRSDMQLGVIPIEIIETDNPIESKKQIIAAFPEKVQKDRKLFLQKMTAWRDKAR